MNTTHEYYFTLMDIKKNSRKGAKAQRKKYFFSI